MLLRRLKAGGDQALRHRDAGRAKQLLGHVLLHRQRRGQHAGMAVGDGENFQHALQGAILARPPVQDVERHVGLDGAEHGRDVASDIDLGDAVAADLLQRLGASLAGAQRDLALGRPASIEDRDVLGHAPLGLVAA